MAKKLTSDDVRFNLIIDGNEAQSSITKFTERIRELKDNNDKLKIAMQQLEAQGKKNTDEYRALAKAYKDNTAEANTNKEMVRSLEKQLGLTDLTMRQLGQRAKELKGQLSNTSKGLNPEAYARIEKELNAINKRMVELKNNSGFFSKIKDGFSSVFAGVSAANVLGKVVSGFKKVVGDTLSSAQVLSDKWEVMTAGMKAGYNSFLKTIATGDWGNLFNNMERAIKAGKEYQKILDELGDRRRAFTLTEAEANVQLEQLQQTFQNVNLSIAERKNALNEYNKTLEGLGATRKDMIKQELDGYKHVLSSVTQLSDEENYRFIRRYDEDKKLREQAEVYLKDLDDYEKSIVKTGYMLNGVYIQTGTNFDKAAKQRVDATDEEVKHYANLLQAFGAANDKELDKYVDLQKQYVMVDAETLAEKQKSSKRLNSLTKESNEEARKQALSALEKMQAERRLLLTQQYEQGKGDEKAFQSELTLLELVSLQERLALLTKQGQDTTAVQQQIADKTIAIKKAALKDYEDIDRQMSKSVSDAMNEVFNNLGKSAPPSLFDEDALNADDERIQRTAELYKKFFDDSEKLSEIRKAKLKEVDEAEQLGVLNAQEASQERLEVWGEFIGEWTEEVANKFSAGVDMAANAVNALQDAAIAESDLKREQEMGKLNEQYNREVAAAAGNEEKIKAIDAKYASDKEKIEYDSKNREFEIQKQYADANFGIQVAQIIASTAQGVMNAWSSAMVLPPPFGEIAGAALAGVIIATGAQQVKAANAQRQSIKAQTLQAPASSSASNSSSGSSPSVVAAYDTGGYTGDGGVYEPAGIVHKGEYVVPQVVMRDPESLDYVTALERIRRSKGLATHAPKRGYATGGMVSDAPTSVGAVDAAAISKLEAVVQKLENAVSNFPARVYVTTDDISDGLNTANKVAVRTNQ